MKAIERIYQYIDLKHIKPSSLERACGISNGYLGKQYRRLADIGESIMNSILENCPDLNPVWLITGKGDMLIITTQIQEASHKEDSPLQTDSVIILLKEQLQEARAEIKELNREIGILQNKNSQLEQAMGFDKESQKKDISHGKDSRSSSRSSDAPSAGAHL